MQIDCHHYEKYYTLSDKFSFPKHIHIEEKPFLKDYEYFNLGIATSDCFIETKKKSDQFCSKPKENSTTGEKIRAKTLVRFTYDSEEEQLNYAIKSKYNCDEGPSIFIIFIYLVLISLVISGMIQSIMYVRQKLSRKTDNRVTRQWSNDRRPSLVVEDQSNLGQSNQNHRLEIR